MCFLQQPLFLLWTWKLINKNKTCILTSRYITHTGIALTLASLSSLWSLGSLWKDMCLIRYLHRLTLEITTVVVFYMWLFWLTKVSFKLANIISVIYGTFKTGSKNVCPSPLTTVHIFSEMCSHGGLSEGQGLITHLLHHVYSPSPLSSGECTLLFLRCKPSFDTSTDKQG